MVGYAPTFGGRGPDCPVSGSPWRGPAVGLGAGCEKLLLLLESESCAACTGATVEPARTTAARTMIKVRFRSWFFMRMPVPPALIPLSGKKVTVVRPMVVVRAHWELLKGDLLCLSGSIRLV